MNTQGPMDADAVFTLWCRLTGTDPREFAAEERLAFLARPQVPDLATVPFESLLDAGIVAARHGLLPLERWLDAVRTCARSVPDHPGTSRSTTTGR